MRRLKLHEAAVAGVVLVVLGSLVAVAALRYRESARRSTCQDNLRRIGRALIGHHDDFGVFPPGKGGDLAPFKHLSWAVWTYPRIGEKERWEAATMEFLYEPRHFDWHSGFHRPVPTFSCPADPRAGMPHWIDDEMVVALTSYQGSLGTDFKQHDGVLFLDSRIGLQDVTRGAAHTLLVGERPPSFDLEFGWLYGGMGQGETGSTDFLLGTNEINAAFSRCRADRLSFRRTELEHPCAVLHFWSMHPGGALFLYVDGHVEFKTYGAADDLIRAGRRTAEPQGDRR